MTEDEGKEPTQERPRMTREGLRILVDEGDNRLQEWDSIEAGSGQAPPSDVEHRRRLLREAVREGNDRLGRKTPPETLTLHFGEHLFSAEEMRSLVAQARARWAGGPVEEEGC